MVILKITTSFFNFYSIIQIITITSVTQLLKILESLNLTRHFSYCFELSLLTFPYTIYPDTYIFMPQNWADDIVCLFLRFHVYDLG